MDFVKSFHAPWWFQYFLAHIGQQAFVNTGPVLNLEVWLSFKAIISEPYLQRQHCWLLVAFDEQGALASSLTLSPLL